MKTIIFSIMTAAIASTFSSPAQEEKFIEQTIVQFVKGTSSRDVYNMNYILHEKFQAVIAIHEISMISKSDYMKMLAWKELGGTKQDVEIVSLEIAEFTAAAKVKITSIGGVQEMFYHLYRDSNGGWQMLYVLPHGVNKV
jgi:hypothetical protein